MKKYPVISKKGNRYEVSIFYGKCIRYAGMNIIISEKREGLFNRTKTVELERYNKLMSERRILEKYSYVDLAKYYVNKYEKENRSFIEYVNKVDGHKREFEVWDGKC